MNALTQTSLPFPKRSGKVRDVYDLGDTLLIVATDRISAFDCIMPQGIPDKGKILTALSLFWFEKFSDFDNHLLATHVRDYPKSVQPFAAQIEGRSMLCRKADVIPIECVARGYITGSGWKEYRANGQIAGHTLPPNLKQCDPLPAPIFTPATKEESGHDINITPKQAAELIGEDLAAELARRTLSLYTDAAAYAKSRGVLIADTKFEFGIVQGSGLRSQASVKEGQPTPGLRYAEDPDSSPSQHSALAEGKPFRFSTQHSPPLSPDPRALTPHIILIDEVLTPDSSRFWPAAEYEPGHDQPSFDKQFLRNWLEAQPWNKTPPAPQLPTEVIWGTRRRYLDAYERLTGKSLSL